MSFPLQTEFQEAIDDLDIKWNIKALVDEEDSVYSLTHDSKVIGPLFEIASAPAIRWVAENNGMEVVPAENQNIAPDFSLINQDILESDDRMRKGDRIIEINGEQISDREDVEEAIDDFDEDETISCRVERDSDTERLELHKSEFNKIGIDIKSTYRECYQTTRGGHDAGDVKPFDWTLGGYRSFLRKPTKNIQYD
jgi:membrane-associated protease RseP (regulator of RpoE activity)